MADQQGPRQPAKPTPKPEEPKTQAVGLLRVIASHMMPRTNQGYMANMRIVCLEDPQGNYGSNFLLDLETAEKLPVGKQVQVVISELPQRTLAAVPVPTPAQEG